jgi:MFS family permease
VALGVLAAYHQFKLPPVLPVLLQTYHYERVLAGSFMSVFALVGMVLSSRLGHLIQRHGSGPYLGSAFGCLLAGSALTLAIPQSGTIMLFAWALEGTAVATLAVLMGAIVNRNASERGLGIAIGIQTTWIPAGQVIATLVSEPALTANWWQLVWWLGVAFTLAVAAATVALARAQVVDLQLAPPRAGRGPGMLGGPERRVLVMGALVFGLWSGQYIAFMTWFAVYLVDAHGLSPDLVAIGYLLPVVIVRVFNVIGGLIIHAGVPVIPFLFVTLVPQAMGWMLLSAVSSDFYGLVVLMIWAAAGMTPTCLWALPATLLGREGAGAQAFGVTMAGQNIGVFVGPILLAVLLDQTQGWGVVALVFGLVATICAGSVLAFGRAHVRLVREGHP